ncbi:MAG: hypothetical protein ACK5Z0_02180 [Planctomycetota bacterium]|jgi:hypothetical protein
MSSSESPNKPGGYTVGLSTARFLDQAMLDDVAPVVPVPPTPRQIVPASPPPSPSSTRVESDEDVNSYMQQLLQRSNKLAPAAPVAAPTSASQPTVSSTPSADVESVGDAPASQETGPEDNWSTEEYMPKKTAPEREADLRAFRQLANASARGALNSFQQREHRKQSQVSGIVAICSFATAIPLFLLSSQWGDNWSLCSLGAIALAGSSAWHYYKSGQSAKMKR